MFNVFFKNPFWRLFLKIAPSIQPLPKNFLYVWRHEKERKGIYPCSCYSASLTGKKDSGSEQIGFTDFSKIKVDKNVYQFKKQLETGKHHSLLATCELYLKNETTYKRKELVKQNHIELLKNQGNLKC